MAEKIIVSGTGCCLVDLLYSNIDFNGANLKPLLSKNRGDGGLTPGHLVFQEEFEKFCRKPFADVLKEIIGERSYDKINIGGPSIVSLIHLAQMVQRDRCEVRFYGRGGADEIGNYLNDALRKTPVVLKNFRLIENRTPSTVVLSDPSYDSGHGERMFLNSIGAAWDFMPEELDDDFFRSDIVVFGGTALVPQIHDNLTDLLIKAKSGSCITIVNTVFDFRNEKASPSERWPLGKSDESYRNIDLLIADNEEACRLSGGSGTASAVRFFTDRKVSSFIITNGSKNITIWSDGKFFKKCDLTEMPVSGKIVEALRDFRGGDTTGCGDNFVGGVIASVVEQIQSGTDQPDIREACSLGIVSGGFTCFYMGGTYFEDKTGEKRAKILPYLESYKEQMIN